MTSFIIFSASVGYAVESVFGFGGAVIIILLLTTTIPSKEVVSLLPVFDIAATLFIVLSDWRSVQWKTVGTVCIYAVPGLMLGSLFMGGVPEQVFKPIVLAIIIVYGMNLVRGKTLEVPTSLKKPFYVLAGLVMGATGIGMLFIPVIGSDFGDKRSFRASLGFFWFVTAITRLPLYLSNGVLSPEGISHAGVAVPFLLAAILLGYGIHRIIPSSQYRRYVGVAILFTALINMIETVL